MNILEKIGTLVGTPKLEEEKKYKVICITCTNQVEVTFPFRRRREDKAFIATCPLCKGLAYSSEEEPSQS